MVTMEKILQTMNSWQWGEVIAVRRKKCLGASSRPSVDDDDGDTAHLSQDTRWAVWAIYLLLRQNTSLKVNEGEQYRHSLTALWYSQVSSSDY